MGGVSTGPRYLHVSGVYPGGTRDKARNSNCLGHTVRRNRKQIWATSGGGNWLTLKRPFKLHL